MNYNYYKCTFLDENFIEKEIKFEGNITFSIIYNENNTKDISFSEPTNFLPENDEDYKGLDVLWENLYEEKNKTNLRFYIIFNKTEEGQEHFLHSINTISNFEYRTRIYDQSNEYLFEKIMEIG